MVAKVLTKLAKEALKRSKKAKQKVEKKVDETLTSKELKQKEKAQSKTQRKRAKTEKEKQKNPFETKKGRAAFEKLSKDKHQKATQARLKKGKKEREKIAAEKKADVSRKKKGIKEGATIAGTVGTLGGISAYGLSQSAKDTKSDIQKKVDKSRADKKTSQTIDALTAKLKEKQADKKAKVKTTSQTQAGTEAARKKPGARQRSDAAISAATKPRAKVTGREDDMASRNISLFGGEKRANVTREQMTNLGLDPKKKSDLTRYLNAYDGLGRRPKTKADLEGYAKGGSVKKQGSDDRLDESLGERRGAERTKSQSFKSRRNESRGARKPRTPQSAGAAKRGWGAVMK